VGDYETIDETFGYTVQECEVVINKPNDTLLFGETATVSLIPWVKKDDSNVYKASEITDIKWWLPDQTTVKFTGRNYYEEETGHWIGEDVSHSIPIMASQNTGLIQLVCEFTSFLQGDNPTNHLLWKHTKGITIHVINDIIEIEKEKVEAPSVGNPMLTPLFYLTSNCGGQVYQNSMVNSQELNNVGVSATIYNTFSAGYSIQAAGDPAIKIPTSTLTNLSFQLVDMNFRPIKLFSPMSLTITVTPIELPANELGDMMIPKNLPTSAQKAQQIIAQQQQAEADAKQQAEAKEKEETQSSAFQCIVQYFKPLIEQQQAIVQQQQAEAQKEQDMMSLLQTPAVLEQLKGLDKDEVAPYLQQMQQQMAQQRQQDAQQAQEQLIEEEEARQNPPPPPPPQIHPVFWDADLVDK
jgi:hypothetical protein